MILNQFQAAIFDMDGLLLDTERISLDTFMETGRLFNFEANIETYLKCVGTNEAKTKEIILEAYGAEFPYEAMRKVWLEKYEKLVRSTPNLAKAGAKKFLEFIEESSLKIALATSTNHKLAREKLEHAGLSSFFKTIVGGDQVEHSKPAPEIYLKAAQLIEVDPKFCLALEDSDNGVKAAHHAGMTVIQIPDLKEPSSEVKAFGHHVLPSLEVVQTFLKSEELAN